MEPVAGGLRYLGAVGERVQLGFALNVGPVFGAVISDNGIGDLREWGSFYPVVVVRPAAGVRAFVSPIGIAGMVGNDFGAVYPSAQAGVEVDVGPIRIGSSLRAVRIAGGNGSGRYRLEWIPIRFGYALTW